ncbi:hypothetical protein ACMAZE_11975 [Pseudopelagicola sp. nBUS_20]|uniref:hypothetical protein n=1 Tax=Pseudopelagicola sp. nBUS_20 TaxID=3395317 RepID=UPI003EBAC460
MKQGLILIAIGLFALSGCSSEIPVVGKIEKTEEEFIGSANALKGEITGIIYPSGATCMAPYKTHLVYDSNSTYSLNGTIKCSDGRTGTWSAAGSNSIGRGIGTLGGEKMSISFGNVGIINSY